MTCVVWVAITLVLFGVGMRLLLWFARSDALQDGLRSLADQYRGVYDAAGWWSPTSAMFLYAGGVRVKARRKKSQDWNSPYLEVMVDWPGGQPQCRLASVGRANLGDAGDRGRAMSVDQDFDRDFQLHGPAEATSLISDGVRWKLRQLRGLDGPRRLELVIQGKLLTVRVDGPFRSPKLVVACVEAALSLYDQVKLTQCRGIEFVQRDMEVVQEARCQVCGVEVVTDMVFCRKCGTPHHAECWVYIGKCSVYGCGESQCVAPRVAGPPR